MEELTNRRLQVGGSLGKDLTVLPSHGEEEKVRLWKVAVLRSTSPELPTPLSIDISSIK